MSESKRGMKRMNALFMSCRYEALKLSLLFTIIIPIPYSLLYSVRITTSGAGNEKLFVGLVEAAASQKKTRNLPRQLNLSRKTTFGLYLTLGMAFPMQHSIQYFH